MTTTFAVLLRTAQAQAELAKLQASFATTYGIISASTKMADAALKLVAGAIIAVGAAALITFSAVNKFNEALTHVRALGELSVDQMNGLASSINRVSAEFGVSGDIIAEGAVVLSKAGLSIEEINSSIRSMTALAKANGIAFEEAAEITVFAVETFRKSYSEVPDLLDKMQVAAQASILDIGDLQQAFAYAGSTASLTGISFEQLISIMAVLSNRALEAGISSRSVNKMFLDILDSTEQMQDWVDTMGFGFNVIKDGKLNIDDLIRSFGEQELSIKLLQDSTDIFTVRALRAWGLLLSGAEDYDEMLGIVNNSAGALERVVGVQMESFTAQFSRLKQEILSLMRTPEAMAAVQEMVEALVKLFTEIKPELIGQLVEGTKAFGEFLGAEATRDILVGVLEAVFKLINAGGTIIKVFSMWDSKLLKLAIVLKIFGMVTSRGALAAKAFGMAMITNTTATIANAQAIKGTTIAIGNATTILNLKTGATTRAAAVEMLLHAQLTKTGLLEEQRILGMQRYAARMQMVTQVIGQGVAMGAMFAMMQSNQAKAMIGVIVILNALTIAYTVAAAAKLAFMSPWWGAVASGAFLAAAFGSYMLFKSQMEDFNVPTAVPVADTGYFAPSAGVRHRPVFIEPGEQIISKTQGMVGAAAPSIIINIGDLSVADGTDFARRLELELPYALRRASDAGGI